MNDVFEVMTLFSCSCLLYNPYVTNGISLLASSVRNLARLWKLTLGFLTLPRGVKCYYGLQVVQQYSLVLFTDDRGQRYVFGASLFLGWAAMGIGILGGAIMVCGSFYVESEDDEYWNKGKVGHGLRRMRESFRSSYRAVRPRPRDKPAADYVWRKTWPVSRGFLSDVAVENADAFIVCSLK